MKAKNITLTEMCKKQRNPPVKFHLHDFLQEETAIDT